MCRCTIRRPHTARPVERCDTIDRARRRTGRRSRSGEGRDGSRRRQRGIARVPLLVLDPERTHRGIVTTRSCHACGAELRSQAHFCPACGAAAAPERGPGPSPKVLPPATPSGVAQPPSGKALRPSTPAAGPVVATQAAGRRRAATIAGGTVAAGLLVLAGIIVLGGGREATSGSTTVQPSNAAPRSTAATGATTTPSSTTAPAPTPLRGTSAVASNERAPVNGLRCTGQYLAYTAEQLVDGDPQTGWGASSTDGSGQYITITFSGPRHLTSVGLTPGYLRRAPHSRAGCAEVVAFDYNRFVTAVEYQFDDGSTVDQTFARTPTMQTMPVDVSTQSVRITILGTQHQGQDDDTILSEAQFEGYIE